MSSEIEANGEVQSESFTNYSDIGVQSSKILKAFFFLLKHLAATGKGVVLNLQSADTLVVIYNPEPNPPRMRSKLFIEALPLRARKMNTIFCSLEISHEKEREQQTMHHLPHPPKVKWLRLVGFDRTHFHRSQPTSEEAKKRVIDETVGYLYN